MDSGLWPSLGDSTKSALKSSSSESLPEINVGNFLSSIMASASSKSRMSFQEVLNDLCCRFVVNACKRDLESAARIMHLVQSAHWFYQDKCVKSNRSLKSMSFEDFTYSLFNKCDVLSPLVPSIDEIFTAFKSYNRRIPFIGAIILDQTYERCLLFKDWEGRNWSFPVGKRQKAEDDEDTAIREMVQKQISSGSGSGCDLLTHIPAKHRWLVYQNLEDKDSTADQIRGYYRVHPDRLDYVDQILMVQKQISSGSGSLCDLLPPLPAKYPNLVYQNMEDKDCTAHQIFYTINDLLSQHMCRIPELQGRQIRGYYHGWVVLSMNAMWSLWSPMTSTIICLPPLVLKGGDTESTEQCCLLSSSDELGSVLLLTTMNTRSIFLCRIDHERKGFIWEELSYAKQLMSITDKYDFLECLSCCNGKLYALHSRHDVIQVDIVVNNTEVMINLLPFVELPLVYPEKSFNPLAFLKGSSTELFYIFIVFDEECGNNIYSVKLFKLDMTTMMWEELEDLKDAIFFVDGTRPSGYDCSLFYKPTASTELGGYIHYHDKMRKKIYSFNVKDKTVSLSVKPCMVAPSHVSSWNCRLQRGLGEIKCRKQEHDKEDMIIDGTGIVPHDENIESHLLNIPFDILIKIIELCVGVEYLRFRATCRNFHLAAPVIRWSNESASRKLRLQKYSVVSPWLMVIDIHKGIITFTDPMFGDEYFIKTPRNLIGDMRIHYSMYGWLLIHMASGPLVFFNPFTTEIHELPEVPFFDTFCFSSPPTSPDCIVVGIDRFDTSNLCIHSVARDKSWRLFTLSFEDADPYLFSCPTFHGQDLYTMVHDGEVEVFKNLRKEDRSWERVAKAPKGCCRPLAQYYLVKCEQYFLLVIVGDSGKSIEVFKSHDFSGGWEKINGLGRHVIFICGATCLCIEAKTPEMENKIYFPHLHSKNGKLIFYSLETYMYHTFNGRNIEESFPDFFGTKYHTYPCAWVEPSWC